MEVEVEEAGGHPEEVGVHPEEEVVEGTSSDFRSDVYLFDGHQRNDGWWMDGWMLMGLPF